MLNVPSKVRIFLCRSAIDMRKGFEGLHGVVLEVLRQDPLSGDLFVFLKNRRDRVKLLLWDGDGMLIVYKRLERGTFQPPAFFQQLYDIEDRARTLSPQQRYALRQAVVVPLWALLRAWADTQAELALPKSKLGEALGYLRNQGDAPTTYVQDGCLPIDNNDVERDLRALTIGSKNWLFGGSQAAGPRAAILDTVVASAARHDLDVWAYLRDVLERLAAGHADLASLLPDVWAAAHPDAIRSYRVLEREAAAAARRARRERRRARDRAKVQRP